VRTLLAAMLILLALVTGGVVGWQTWRTTGSVFAGVGVFLLINAFAWVRGSSTNPWTPGIGWVVARAAENAPVVSDIADHPSSSPEALKRMRWASWIWWPTILVAVAGGFTASLLKQANPTWPFWHGGSGAGKVAGLLLFVLPIAAMVLGIAQAAPVDFRNVLRGSTGDDDLDSIARWERRQLLIGLLQGGSAIAVLIWLIGPSMSMMGL